MKKKAILLMLVSVLTGGVLAGCSTKTEIAVDKPATTEERVEESETAEEENKTEVEAEGKIIKPLDQMINLQELEGNYSCSIDAVDVSDDGTVQCKVSIYTMDLYDAVDITSMKKGDTIVINNEDMVVDTVEEGNPVEMPGTEEGTSEKQAVYLINGDIDEGGASLIAYEGGTFRYFGMDNHATYTLQGEVTLPLAKDALIEDHSQDYNTEETDSAGTTVKTEEFKAYYDNDSYYSTYNTTIEVKNGEITKIVKIFIP